MSNLISISKSTSSYVTIDWKSFWYDENGVKGISLRAMVDQGLYSHYKDAVKALQREGITVATVAATVPEGGGIAPNDHIILDLIEAQMFAATTRTEVGKEILRLIITHHNDFQKLLEGDIQVAQKVADHIQQNNQIGQVSILRMMADELERVQEEAIREAARDASKKIAASEQKLMGEIAVKMAPPAMTMRAEIREMVGNEAQLRGGEDRVVFPQIWNQLYNKFLLTHEINLKLRAKNKAKSKKGTYNALDYAEEFHHLENLWKLAKSLFGTAPASQNVPKPSDHPTIARRTPQGPIAAKTAQKGWENDSIRSFLEAFADPQASHTAKDLYGTFKSHAKTKGFDEISFRSFTNRLFLICDEVGVKYENEGSSDNKYSISLLPNSSHAPALSNHTLSRDNAFDDVYGTMGYNFVGVDKRFDVKPNPAKIADTRSMFDD